MPVEDLEKLNPKNQRLLIRKEMHKYARLCVGEIFRWKGRLLYVTHVFYARTDQPGTFEIGYQVLPVRHPNKEFPQKWRPAPEHLYPTRYRQNILQRYLAPHMRTDKMFEDEKQ